MSLSRSSVVSNQDSERAQIQETEIIIDHPNLNDADGIFQLAQQSGVLDVNSRYAYLLWCDRFAATSLVIRRAIDTGAIDTGAIDTGACDTTFHSPAQNPVNPQDQVNAQSGKSIEEFSEIGGNNFEGIASAGRVMGFLTGFIPPEQPDTFFLWQIAISPQLRGRRLGSTLIRQMLSSLASSGVRYLEAHVGESNEPSARLFKSIAKSVNAALSVKSGFRAALFGVDNHEPERLFRVGPIN